MDRLLEAPIHPDATEDGSQTGGEEPHANHSIDCARSSPSQPRLQQRERLRDENKRLHQPSCRMNDAEYQLLARAAATCHMSVAGFLARAALDAARDLGRTAADVAGEREMLQELFALRRHLGQLGNNLNQVAKALNSGADAPQAEAVLAAVQRTAKRVDAFTQHHLDNRTAG
ncbi:MULTISPECIES: plasmid mobilization protein [Streptomyces]|uniref:Plasmid mobilization relaxosome protein MobC n=1 Tax=Streptomyces edwardsiae TaxID=3075527 RepID=A0ABU2QRZ0_9ACTN|nr:plasmid mobilization relaxosome protein MobC [Streptomyces sp. DSM 41635]MDT0405765.1 plasmid mobilization relaxosome protein MobC [Streptomyces sp. DSM 41635]